MTARRFPAPCTFDEHNDACFIVKDANGANIAYVYYEEERGRRTHDQGRSAADSGEHREVAGDAGCIKWGLTDQQEHRKSWG